MGKEVSQLIHPRNHEGIRLFADVSSTYPASITAQAAGVAKYCKEHGKTAKLIGDLLHDEQAVQSIFTAAKTRHEQKRVRIEDFSEDKVKYILKKVKGLAHRMKKLSLDELQTILSLYPNNVYKEFEYRKIVERNYLLPKFLRHHFRKTIENDWPY